MNLNSHEAPSTNNHDNGGDSSNVVENGSSTPKPSTATTNSSIIGSKNSAFQPYKSMTVLTNLQRGNVKTLNREVTATTLNFYEKAARGELTSDDVNESNVNSVDEAHKTALIWASFHARLPTVKMLIEKGAHVDYASPTGQTALMFASSGGHVSIVNYLLTHGKANVSLVDNNGNSALIYATFGNHAPSITALLQHGASLTSTNYNGDSAFNISVSKNLHAAQFAMENYLRELFEKNLIKKTFAPTTTPSTAANVNTVNQLNFIKTEPTIDTTVPT